MPPIYVSGHRNPDADSIAAAIGYAELKGRLDTRNTYTAVRLGPCNSQTRWLLERSAASQPELLPHVMVRATDVMRTGFPIVGQDAPIREAGLEMARAGLELVPIVDDDGALVGVVTERALARRYIRETRETSTLQDAPTRVGAIVEVLDGKLLTGEDKSLSGRVWVQAMDLTRTGISEGDVVVVGNRTDAQRMAIEHGARLIVLSNDSTTDGRDPRSGPRARDCGDRVPARQLRVGPDDHAGGAVQCADGARAADRHRGGARGGHLRADQGEPLRRGGRDRLSRAARSAS